MRLLKDAMREVAAHTCQETRGTTATVDLEDRLGITMKILRAMERCMSGEISLCSQRYSVLGSPVENPYEVGGNLTARLRPVRDHAISLAREHALDELGKAKGAAKEGDQTRATRAKQKYSR